MSAALAPISDVSPSSGNQQKSRQTPFFIYLFFCIKQTKLNLAREIKVLCQKCPPPLSVCLSVGLSLSLCLAISPSLCAWLSLWGINYSGNIREFKKYISQGKKWKKIFWTRGTDNPLLRCSCLHFGVFHSIYSICVILSGSAKSHNTECNSYKRAGPESPCLDLQSSSIH